MSLHVIIGPMFSGKSTELLRLVRRYEVGGKKILTLKPKIDDRYSSAPKIVTHDKIMKDCYVISDLREFVNHHNVKKYDVIAIDEAQFISNIEDVDILAKTHIIVCAGLSGDYKKNNFKCIADLLPKADTITHLKAVCNLCGVDASFTKKIHGGDNIIEIGGADKYIPVCRKCF